MTDKLAEAFILAQGMTAENEQRKIRGESMAFVFSDFAKLLVKDLQEVKGDNKVRNRNN